MKILEAKWAEIQVAFLFAILLGLSSSCSANTSDAPSKVRQNKPSTPIEVSEDFKKEENTDATQESDDDKKEDDGDGSSNEFTDVDFDDI